MKKSDEISAAARALGKRGGSKTLERHGQKHFVKAAQASLKARRAKQLQDSGSPPPSTPS